MTNREHIVTIAKSYLGTCEGSSNFRDILYFFNSVKPQNYTAKSSDEWCAIFVSACAIQSFGKKDALTYIPLSASCPYLIKLAKAKSIWIESDKYVPDKGDFILYDWEDNGKGDNRGTPNHVGIIEKVTGKTITVIEGNRNEKVKRRKIDVNARFIRGFIHPHYENITNDKVYRKTNNEIVKEVLSGIWGNGETRKTALINAGYDYHTIQKEVSRITKLTNQALEGKYGVGDDRKKSLGADYKIVQWNINRIKEKESEK